MKRKISVLALCVGMSAVSSLSETSRADVIPISCERHLDVETWVLDTDTFEWNLVGSDLPNASLGAWNVEEHIYLADGWNRSNTFLGVGPYADLYVANYYDFTDYSEPNNRSTMSYVFEVTQATTWDLDVGLASRVNGSASLSITRDPDGVGETVFDESVAGGAARHIEQALVLNPGVYRFDASVIAGMPDWYDEASLGRVVFSVPGPSALALLAVVPMISSRRRR